MTGTIGGAIEPLHGLVKTDARPVRCARYAVFLLAETVPPRDVCTGVLDLINGLRGPPLAAAPA